MIILFCARILHNHYQVINKDNYVYYPFSWKSKQPSCNKNHNSGHEGTCQLYLILFWPYLSYGCVEECTFLAHLTQRVRWALAFTWSTSSLNFYMLLIKRVIYIIILVFKMWALSPDVTNILPPSPQFNARDNSIVCFL